MYKPLSYVKTRKTMIDVNLRDVIITYSYLGERQEHPILKIYSNYISVLVGDDKVKLPRKFNATGYRHQKVHYYLEKNIKYSKKFR